MLQLDLQVACEQQELPTFADFELWAVRALSAAIENRFVLTLRLVDADEIQTLNRDYRGKDSPTNVLSFPFEPIPQVEEDILGDVVICSAIVAQEAGDQGKTPMAHWAHMTIHGILHLCGFDHMTDEEAAQMESLEVQILSGLGYPNPYNNE